MTLLTNASRVDQPAFKMAGSPGYHILRIAIGGLLLLAAALKGHELATGPVPGSGLLVWRPLLIAAVEIELVLGLCLVAGLWPRHVWAITRLAFALFASITLYKLLSGADSCGCFGKVRVNPAFTLMLDLAALVALSILRPPSHRPNPTPPTSTFKPLACALIAAALGIPGGIAMATYKPPTLTHTGELPADAPLVLLEPQAWIGKPFPLSQHIDIGQRLAAGTCLVLFYHHDCPDCQQVVPQLVRSLSADTQNSLPCRLFFIAVPPFGPLPGKNSLPPDDNYAFGRLSDRTEWFVQTPTAVILNNGIVTHHLTGMTNADVDRALALCCQ